MDGLRFLSALILSVTFFAGTGALRAQERVDVELVLAVDVSGSMQYAELQLQRDGYVAAFRSPDVIDAIRLGGYGRVAVTYIEWARSELTRVIVPWTIIDGRETAEAFANRLEAALLSNMRNTSISGAIRYGAAAFDDNDVRGVRRIIDISGDGPNNQGGLVTTSRDVAISAGITINGLPLMIDPWLSELGLGLPELDAYYRKCVTGGPGSFVLPVTSWEEFPEAVRRKLVLELSGRKPAQPLVMKAEFVRSPEIDCAIGEKLQRANDN